MRVFSNRNEDLSLYILSNTHFTVTATKPSGKSTANTLANTASGADSITVQALEYFNMKTKTWNSNFAWTSNTRPARGDSWNLGEVDPNNFYRDTTDKLFKNSNNTKNVPNVFVDSDTVINYTPVTYTDTFSPLVPPPAPDFTLRAIPTSLPDGSVTTDLEVSDVTDVSGYPIAIKTIYEYSVPGSLSEIEKVLP